MPKNNLAVAGRMISRIIWEKKRNCSNGFSGGNLTIVLANQPDLPRVRQKDIFLLQEIVCDSTRWKISSPAVFFPPEGGKWADDSLWGTDNFFVRQTGV